MESNNEMESRLVFPPLGAEETTEVAVIGRRYLRFALGFFARKSGKERFCL